MLDCIAGSGACAAVVTLAFAPLKSTVKTGRTSMIRIGYAPGAYDLFHIGHLNLLRRAKEHCEYLIAGVVADEVLIRHKGVTPVIPLAERIEIIRNVRFVDAAIPALRTIRSKSGRIFASTYCSRETTGRAPKRATSSSATLRRLVSRLSTFPTRVARRAARPPHFAEYRRHGRPFVPWRRS